MNNISDVIPNGKDALNIRLEEVSVIEEDRRFFLSLRYRYKTQEGVIHDLIFPKVVLPFPHHALPILSQSFECGASIGGPVMITPDSETLLDYDDHGYKIIHKIIGKEMTLDEISKALGYNVIIKEENNNE